MRGATGKQIDYLRYIDFPIPKGKLSSDDAGDCIQISDDLILEDDWERLQRRKGLWGEGKEKPQHVLRYKEFKVYRKGGGIVTKLGRCLFKGVWWSGKLLTQQGWKGVKVLVRKIRS